MRDSAPTRRIILSAAAGALLVPALGGRLRAAEPKEPKVTPAEDLMREHGVLRRVLLVYDEIATRFERGRDAPLDVLASGAELVRRFVEDYHEKTEEEEVFPRLERGRKLEDLVALLRAQHEAGRRVTERIRSRTEKRLAAPERKDVAGNLRAFAAMYRAHAAREDTVLFPAFHALVGEHAWSELGEDFEEREEKILGEDGFAKALAEVDRLETAVGIHDLAKLTPA